MFVQRFWDRVDQTPLHTIALITMAAVTFREVYFAVEAMGVRSHATTDVEALYAWLRRVTVVVLSAGGAWVSIVIVDLPWLFARGSGEMGECFLLIASVVTLYW
jgi:hypothetical protein